MNKLVSLFARTIVSYEREDDAWTSHTNYITIEELFDKEIIIEWKHRGSYLNCKEIKDKICFPNEFTTQTPMDTVISCLEYYYNLLYLLFAKRGHCIQYNYDCREIRIIKENCDNLLEHLQYQQKENKQDEIVILIPKNPAAISVAEITENKDIAFAILKYNHASMKGDLEGKKQLLLSIANEYEPLFKNPIDGFSDYFNKVTGILNNLHLRHNNKSGKDQHQLVVDMTNEELEKWYDELYQLLLFCVLIKDNVARKNRMAELLKKLNMK